jgi:PRC-barrel domain
MVTNTTIWNPLTHEDYGLVPGKEVYSRDGEKVGSIKEVWHPEAEFPASRGQHYFLLDPGMLKTYFGDYEQVYLPESAIESVGPDRIVVNLTKDQLKSSGWTSTPANWDRYRPS